MFATKFYPFYQPRYTLLVLHCHRLFPIFDIQIASGSGKISYAVTQVTYMIVNLYTYAMLISAVHNIVQIKLA